MRPIILLLLDLLAVIGAAIAALLLRDNLEFSLQRLEDLLPYIFFSAVAAATVLPIVGTSRGFWHYSTFNDFLRIVLAAFLIVLAATSVTFAYNRLDGLARAVPVLHLILIIAVMSALRAIMRMHHAVRLRPKIEPTLDGSPDAENVLLVGVNVIAELFVRSAREFSPDSIQVVGVLGANDRHRGRLMHGVSILGRPDDLSIVLRQLEVHGVSVRRIVVTAPLSELTPAARDVLREVEDGSSIVVDYFSERVGFMERQGSQSPATPHAAKDDMDWPLPSLKDVARSAVLAQPYWQWKRLFDIVVSFILIVLTAPVMLLIAVGVAMDVGTPVLFWQERPGVLARRLRLYKFRTMHSVHNVAGKRIPEDRRSSVLGRFLRRSRLDELPQLFHILAGQMSFVGPRPLLSAEQAARHSGRLAVRPGLTGWAQVHGGRAVSADDKAAMDLWYIRNASFRIDFEIALKTLHMVFFGERANEGVIAQAWKDAELWQSQLASRRDAAEGFAQAALARSAA